MWCSQVTVLVSLGCHFGPNWSPNSSSPSQITTQRGYLRVVLESHILCLRFFPALLACLAAPCMCCSGTAEPVEEETSLLPCTQTHSLLLASTTEAAAQNRHEGLHREPVPLWGCLGPIAAPSISSCYAELSECKALLLSAPVRPESS